ARCAGRLGLLLAFGLRALGLAFGHVPSLVVDDLCQRVAHAQILTRVSSAFNALPLSIESIAIAAPSFRSRAAPATIRAAALFSNTISRNLSRRPDSTKRMAAALWSGSPPFSSASVARGTPISSGAISTSCTLPFSRDAAQLLENGK